MEANHLRIGNYVGFELDGEYLPSEITLLSFSHTELELLCEAPEGVSHYQHDMSYEYIEPIPLTEEWLLKFGFEDWGSRRLNEYEDENVYCLHNYIDGTSDFIVCFNISTYGGKRYTEWIPKIDDDTIYVKSLEYVHQLQNLYFALTGEELIIEP